MIIQGLKVIYEVKLLKIKTAMRIAKCLVIYYMDNRLCVLDYQMK